MNYLIPANAKKGTLIFGMFTKFDLVLFGIGILVSVLLLISISPETLKAAIICLLPLFISAFLVVPIPNYHNVLTLIKEMIDFFYGRRNYKWEGWCYKNEYK
ncbi:predicted protein [Clostridium sp. CAG:433]|nr:predicted protein [Clostridium sp. CAG:433]